MLELKVWAVRNRDNQWFRAKGYSGTGNSWVDNIKKARLYANKSGAIGRVTWWAKHYPEFGVPDLIELSMANMKVIDQQERVGKAIRKEEIKKRKARLKQHERDVARATRRANEAQQRLADLVG